MKKSLLILFASTLIISCASNKKSSDSSSKAMPVAEIPLAPGTALVEFEVVEITPNEDNETSLYEIKVLNVLKYGPSAPLIDKGSVHTLKLMNDKYHESLKKGTKTAAVLSHEEQIAQYAKQSNWKLLYLKN
tara:strand:+ start:16697 stop:17092 length:396 start_codon:yes stop_codon:yes gene_type:complete